MNATTMNAATTTNATRFCPRGRVLIGGIFLICLSKLPAYSFTLRRLFPAPGCLLPARLWVALSSKSVWVAVTMRITLPWLRLAIWCV